MPFNPKPGTFYRMPVFFGPTPGPRQSPGLESQTLTKHLVLGVEFLSDAGQLQAFLPEGFEVWGEPVVTVDVHYMKQIPWLAGRGYNMSDVKFPAVYHGKQGPVHGTFVLVRWENLADPILSGRDELGHNKLWCNIPEPSVLDGSYRVKLDWLGHPFMDVRLSDLTEDTSPVTADPLHKGQLSFKYVPRTGEWGEADVAYCTLSPRAPGAPQALQRRLKGKGTAHYLKSTFEELPTLYHVVNAFAALEVCQLRGAYLVEHEAPMGASGIGTHIVE